MATVVVTPGTLSLNPGGSGSLAADLRDAQGRALAGRPVAWSSSTPTVATVANDGVVTAVAVGSATITATAEGQSGSAQVTVVWPAADTVVVAPATLSLRPGQTGQFTAEGRTRAGQAIPEKVFTWASSNPLVATVSATGQVSAVAPGVVTISASVDGRIGSATLNVVPGPVASVTVTPPAGAVAVTQTLQLVAVAKDDAGFAVTGAPVTWLSSAPAVASVSQDGLVTGLVPGGPVTITATIGGKSGSATVTVSAGPVATVQVAPATATLSLGQTLQLGVTARDAQGNFVAGRPVTWSSALPLVASVSATGLVTAVLAGGPVTVTAEVDGRQGSAAITVLPVPVVSVSVAPAAASVPMLGTVQLAATPRDSAGTALPGRPVTWSTGNPAIATVSTAGLVNGLAPGQVTITAVSEGKSGSATVTVTPVYYTLTASRSEGVAGTPASTGQHLAGSVVPYAFTAQSTHENLRVRLDDAAVATSGTVTMDRHRSLAAVADQRIVIPPAAQADVNGLADVLRGAAAGTVRPMDAYRATVAAAQSLAGRVPPDSIARLLRVARIRGTSTADHARLAAMLREIDDSLQRTAFSPGPSAAPARNTTAPLPEVVYLYVNGINTDAGASQTTYIHYLDPVVRAAGYTDLAKFKVRRFYNPTGNVDVEDYSALLCLQRAADALLEGAAPELDPNCTAAILAATGGLDLLEAHFQVLARAMRWSSSTPTAQRLADSITATAAGSRVVMVAHSQGNLMVNEAYRELERRGVVNPACIGTVSLAPPVPVDPFTNGWVSERYVAGSLVKDVLLGLEDVRPGTFPRIRTVPTNATALSTYADSRMANSPFSATLQTAPLNVIYRLVLGLGLHGVDASYLAANRPVTIGMLQDQTNELMRYCAGGLDVRPVANSQQMVPLAPVEVQVLGPNGQPAPNATVPVTVSLGVNPGNATLGGTRTVTSVNGVARFTNLTVSQAGSGYTLIATTPNARPDTSAAFNIAPAPVEALFSVSPLVQSAPVGTNVTLTVQVRNEVNQGMSGIPVVFTVTAGGGNFQPSGGNPLTVWTDAQGYASAIWRIGTGVGTDNNVVTAAVTGAQNSPITFRVSGTASSSDPFPDSTFAFIPAGTFQMGGTYEGWGELPVHTVTLTRNFYLQRTEVTQGQWRAIMGTLPPNQDANEPCATSSCPVGYVSWPEIQDFIQRLNQVQPGRNYRLPTEAEWEYAARAGTTGDYGGTGVLDQMGWYSDNSNGRTWPVAQKLPNAWGLFDMHGNVTEWTNDWQGPYPAGPVTDPVGDPNQPVWKSCRGGSSTASPFFARSAARLACQVVPEGQVPGAFYSNAGFRLVRTP